MRPRAMSGRSVRSSLLIILSVVALRPMFTFLEAQTCVGGASFASGAVQVGAGVRFYNGEKSVTGRIGAGKDGGPFINAAVAHLEYDDSPESAVAGSVGLGLSLRMPGGSGEFCPLAEATYGKGPSSYSSAGREDITTLQSSIGGSLGGTVLTLPNFALVPFFGAEFVRTRRVMKYWGNTATDGMNEGIVTAGAGVVIGQVLSIRPVVQFPVGVSYSKVSHGLSLSYSFGPRVTP